MPDMEFLWRIIGNNHSVDLTILSAHSSTGKQSAIDGKRLWLTRNLGVGVAEKAIFCRAKDKCQYSEPHAILIDDTKRNVDQWNEAGGKGILFETAPQSLNDLIDYISEGHYA